MLGLDLQGGISIVLVPGEGLRPDDARHRGRRSSATASTASASPSPTCSRQGNTIVVDLPGVKNRGQGRGARRQDRRAAVPRGASNPSVSRARAAAAAPTTHRVTTGPRARPPRPRRARTTTTTFAPRPATTDDDSGKAARRTARSTRADRRTDATAAHGSSRRPRCRRTATTAARRRPRTVDGRHDDHRTVRRPRAPLQGVPGSRALIKTEPDRRRDQVVLPDREKTSCYVLGPTISPARASAPRARIRLRRRRSGRANVHFKNNDFVNKIARPVRRTSRSRSSSTASCSRRRRSTRASPASDVADHAATSRRVRRNRPRARAALRRAADPVRPDEADRRERVADARQGPAHRRHRGRSHRPRARRALHAPLLPAARPRRVVGPRAHRDARSSRWSRTLVERARASRSRSRASPASSCRSVSPSTRYVVYFERLKDEVRTGKTVRSSLEPGFRRAFRTIVAADLVSLIGAARALPRSPTSSVQGFAFFLGLSTVDRPAARVLLHAPDRVGARPPPEARALPGVGIARRRSTCRERRVTHDEPPRRRADRRHPGRHPPPPAVRPLPRAHELPVHQAHASAGLILSGTLHRAELRGAVRPRPQPRHRLRGRHLVAGPDGDGPAPRTSPTCATCSGRWASPTRRSASCRRQRRAERPRAGARAVTTRSTTIDDALATYGGVTDRRRAVPRRTARAGHVHVHRDEGRHTRPRPAVKAALATTQLAKPDGQRSTGRTSRSPSRRCR